MITFWHTSGLSAEEQKTRLDDVITTNRPGTVKALAAARRFMQRPVGFLSIHGGVGNGKTMILHGIIVALIERGVRARYVTAADMAAYLREAFGTNDSDYNRISRLAEIPVLAIDEFEKLRDTPYSREIQQELLNRRYRNAGKLGTILAWNGGKDAILPAIYSRASEYTICFNGDPDIRPLLGSGLEKP